MLKRLLLAALLCSPAVADEQFLDDYVLKERPFFRICRNPQNGLTYDGVNLDPATLQLEKIRDWSAASKECLDIAVLIKCLQEHRLAQHLASKQEAARLLDAKIRGLEHWTEQNPGYNGFLPWFFHREPLVATPDWKNRIPGLDNGEMFFAQLVAENELRKAGYPEIADRYDAYLQRVNQNLTRLYYDPVKGLVRGDIELENPQSAESPVKNLPKPFYMTGEHGVHEGMMLLMYVSLFAKGLPADAPDRIWAGTEMKRIEHPYGTTWQGYWGSSHESWQYLFLPLRDIPQYADLFRIREKIRYQNAAARKYPGLATSCLPPGAEGYIDGAGIEGVGSQPIRNNHTFAIYGAFPGLLYFHDKPDQHNYAIDWLQNMLNAPHMRGPLGAGESSTNDGTRFAPNKTIDGTHTNLLAMMGGLENEMREALRKHGVYEQFKSIMQHEYDEAFGSAPLKEPYGFCGPSVKF
jgi:hypothetical protein